MTLDTNAINTLIAMKQAGASVAAIEAATGMKKGAQWYHWTHYKATGVSAPEVSAVPPKTPPTESSMRVIPASREPKAWAVSKAILRAVAAAAGRTPEGE